MSNSEHYERNGEQRVAERANLEKKFAERKGLVPKGRKGDITLFAKKDDPKGGCVPASVNDMKYHT